MLYTFTETYRGDQTIFQNTVLTRELPAIFSRSNFKAGCILALSQKYCTCRMGLTRKGHCMLQNVAYILNPTLNLQVLLKQRQESKNVININALLFQEI